MQPLPQDAAYDAMLRFLRSEQAPARRHAGLLDLGAPLTAVEPDQRLANFLRANNPDKALTIVVAPFEDASLEEEAFDLGVSFAAFHWLDEDLALVKIASLLRPGGWWAAIWNVFGDDSRPDPFHEATKELLAAVASPSAGERGIPFGLDSVARLAALERTGAFAVVENRTSRWSLVLDETKRQPCTQLTRT
jgi:hypothetical protein